MTGIIAGMVPLSAFRRYILAALLTLLALALGLLGRRTLGPSATYSFFLLSVMLSSWVGGFGAGILATVLGTIAADYFLVSPLYALTLDVSHLVQLSAFMASAGVISYLNHARAQAIAAVG